jgi:hypothetical protein
MNRGNDMPADVIITISISTKGLTAEVGSADVASTSADADIPPPDDVGVVADEMVPSPPDLAEEADDALSPIDPPDVQADEPDEP